jgi:RNA polymerase sigma-70 factor (ECF subfamily)
VLEKDRKATAEFVARFSDPVYSYLAWRLMPREEDVDDLFQQVFLDAWKSLRQWSGSGDLKGWLLGIARHKVQDLYRRKLREVELPDEADGELASPGDLQSQIIDLTATERVETVLRALPEAPRLLLIWRYWDQQSAQQMALQTGKSVKGVERALARAREQFRLLWEKGGSSG